MNFNSVQNSDVQSILYMDNIGAIELSKSYENSKRAKHIDIKLHFIKDLYSKGEFEIKYVSSKDNYADLLTKSLTKEQFICLRSALSIN